MKVLVANLGSTSFKYRLFDMTYERQLARGGVERIGSPESRCFVEIGSYRGESIQSIPVHGVAVEACIAQLTDPEHGCIQNASEISAIGFKAVHGGRLSGVQRIDAHVLAAMDEMNSVGAGAQSALYGGYETVGQHVSDPSGGCVRNRLSHQTIPEAWKRYALPASIAESLPIRKWGFHGASHRTFSVRMAQLLGRGDARIISCHLGVAHR